LSYYSKADDNAICKYFNKSCKANSKNYGYTNLIKHSNDCYMICNKNVNKKQKTLGIET